MNDILGIIYGGIMIIGVLCYFAAWYMFYYVFNSVNSTINSWDRHYKLFSEALDSSDQVAADYHKVEMDKCNKRLRGRL